MATNDIRALLEEQANQRINPFMKGLSMLTGGIAGEFTGTNEDIRNRNYAKKALMEEGLLMDRMKAQRQMMLEEDLKRLASEREANLLTGTSKARGAAMALSGTAKNYTGPLDAATQAGIAEAELGQAKVESDRMNALKTREPEMRGYLSSRGISLGEPDVETTAFMEAQEKTKEAAQKEARLTKSGYMSFYIPGLGQIGGTPDDIEQTKQKYPQYRNIIDNAIKQAESGEALYSTRLEQNPLTGETKRVLSFKPGTPQESIDAIEKQVFGKRKGFGGEPPKPEVKGTKATKPTSIPGYQVTIPEEEEQ
jgi:hypothetical protein